MSKIRESARNEDCTIRLEQICNFNPETTVLAHPNTHRAGKGKSLKAEDSLGAYSCSNCHGVLDGNLPRPAWMSKEYVENAFWLGHAETFLKLKAKGLVTTK